MIVSRIIPSSASLLTCAVLLSGGIATSCVNDSSLSPEDKFKPNPDNIIWLSFTIKNEHDFGSRSDSPDPDTHPEDIALAAENYIDCDDISVILLDNNNLVRKVFEPNEIVTVPIDNDGSYRQYEIKTMLNTAYFEYAPNDRVYGRLLVVANMSGTGQNNDSFGNDLRLKTLRSLSALFKNFEFSNPSEFTKDMYAENDNISQKPHIPMSGLASFSVSKSDLQKATDDEHAVDLGTVNLQRCIAKIRVIDALADNGYHNTCISSISITGINARGTYLPIIEDSKENIYNIREPSHNTWEYNYETAAVEYATSQDGWIDNKSIHDLTGTIYFDRNHLIDTDDKTYNAFVIYVPEYDLFLHDNSDDDSALRPVMTFTVNAAGQDETYSYKLPRLRHSGILGWSIYNDICRNHIHQFVVTAAGPLSEINLQVLDWDTHETIWDYASVPGTAGEDYIRWTDKDGKPFTVNAADASLVISGGETVTGTFRLATPKEGTWRATLAYETTNDPDAFSFVTANDGEIVKTDEISGSITTDDNGVTEPVSITLTTNHEIASGTNRARLMIYVTTVDGRTMPANVLISGRNIYGNHKYFTIIQNKSGL